MAVKPDTWIKKAAIEAKMIVPFVDHQVKCGISYGLSSYGYDFRVADEFKIFDPVGEKKILDVKNVDKLHFKDFKGDICEVPPHSYVLGRTVEYFRIPRNILTICYGKSTYARCGVTIHVTPFEPEWEGYATIAIVNMSPLPARVYANEGIGQIIFLEASDICEISYADKKGKYQAQKGITIARV